jgi:hypothetical protein
MAMIHKGQHVGGKFEKKKQGKKNQPQKRNTKEDGERDT